MTKTRRDTGRADTKANTPVEIMSLTDITVAEKMARKSEGAMAEEMRMTTESVDTMEEAGTITIMITKMETVTAEEAISSAGERESLRMVLTM